MNTRHPAVREEAALPELDENDPQLVDQMVDLLLPALQNGLARAGHELGLDAPPPLPPRS